MWLYILKFLVTLRDFHSRLVDFDVATPWMQQVVKCKPQVYTDDEKIKVRGRRPRGGTKRLICSWRVGGMFLSKAAFWGSPLTILAVPFGHVFALVRSRGQCCLQHIDRGKLCKLYIQCDWLNFGRPLNLINFNFSEKVHNFYISDFGLSYIVFFT